MTKPDGVVFEDHNTVISNLGPISIRSQSDLNHLMGQLSSVNRDDKYLAYRRCVARVNRSLYGLRAEREAMVLCELNVKSDLSPSNPTQSNSELTPEHQAQILADLSYNNVVVQQHRQGPRAWEIDVVTHLPRYWGSIPDRYWGSIHPNNTQMGADYKMEYWKATKA